MDDLDRELTNYADAAVLTALRLVRERLGLGVEEAFDRLREHPAWRDVTLVHELSDRCEERVVQTIAEDDMVVLKEYVHDQSHSDPPEEDDYRFFEYEFELGDRVREARSYLEDDEDMIGPPDAVVRDADAERIARFLIAREGVRRVTRFDRRTGAYSRIVALGPGWSGLDPLILLVLRDGPVRARDLRAAVKVVDAVAPDKLEVAASLGRLRGKGLVQDDRDRLTLTRDGRRMLAEPAGGSFWDEWDRLGTALEALPLEVAPDA